MIVQGGNFNVVNIPLFDRSVAGLRESLACPDHFFCSDNLITWNKNLSFASDPGFLAAFNRNTTTVNEHAIQWRTYILCHFAQLALRLPGDFVEVGAYRGNTANVIADRVNLGSSDKTYWLYDTFDHTGTEVNHAMPAHSPQLYGEVKARFATYPHVNVIQGHVPDSFAKGFPDQIAFAHIDLNQVQAEIAALRLIIPRLVTGGFLILDDYGWYGYSAQKAAEDPLLAEYGLVALELPTGQGLVIKQ